MIFYSLISNGNEELVQHYDNDGNFLALTRRLLEKIPLTNAKRSFTFEKYNFHYIVHDDIIYLCLAAYDLGMRSPFQFLDDIQHKFKKFCADLGGVDRMNKSDFAPFKLVLQEKMAFYSDPTRSESVAHLKSEADAVVELFQRNIKETNSLTSGKKLQYSNRSYGKIAVFVFVLIVIVGGIFVAVCYYEKFLMFKNR